MKKINDIITSEDGNLYAETAIWCNENGAMMEEIEPEDGVRRFKVVPVPDETDDEKKAAARAERDRRINAILWRIERYQTQKAAGLETTDTDEHYKAILLYVQALRDIPEQEGFPDAIEWPKEQ